MCTYVYHIHACALRGQRREGVQTPGIGVNACCEPNWSPSARGMDALNHGLDLKQTLVSDFTTLSNLAPCSI